MGTVCSLTSMRIFVDSIVELELHSSVDHRSIREVKMDGQKVIILHDKGQVRAFSGVCPHQGGPLVKGVLDGGIIRCAWHGACFNSVTGDIENFPAMDSLVRFDAQDREGVIRVRTRKVQLSSGRRQRHVCEQIDMENKVVVIGGGGAGFSVVQTLREEGFTGQVTLVSSESYLPYDRTRLSKGYEWEHRDLVLRDKRWYDTADIKVMLAKEVDSVDDTTKVVTTKQGDTIGYTHLVLAVGSGPKKLVCLESTWKE